MLRWMIGALLALALTTIARQARAGDLRLPARLRMTILFKALTYDRNLTHWRARLNVGILCHAGSEDDRRLGRETAAELVRIQDKRVKGLNIRHDLIMLKDAGKLEALVKAREINLIYLCPGVEQLLGAVRALARQQRILIVSGEAKHMGQGAALAVVQRGTRPKILIDLTTSRAQGASFDARLLNLSDVTF